ncbi:hypothetical protein [Pedobacter sp. MW01-1-1]|uniref:hypothetical protein n=1 Tax=Pedobacter sp. MW01-1-1 TaxID=3383027 RepID=UPI003FED874F
MLLRKPRCKNQLRAWIVGNPNANLPENLLSTFMKVNNLKRIDSLGKGSGLWSLHPPYRTQGFYNQLTDLINKTENKLLPLSQHGFYDVIDEVIDWTEAREERSTKNWIKRNLKLK